MANFESQIFYEIEYEHDVLLHDICKEIGVHRGTSFTAEPYIAPYPVVHDGVPSPSFVFKFTGDSLILQQKSLGLLFDPTTAGYMQPYTFLLADPEFFTKVRNHVYKEWKHGRS